MRSVPGAAPRAYCSQRHGQPLPRPVAAHGVGELAPVWAKARRELACRTGVGRAWEAPGGVPLSAGLPLLLARPGGGTPADYVQELSERFALLGIDP
jgi:hypothetical protein